MRCENVVVFGGWDFLPPLFWGWVWFPFCLLVFLAFWHMVGLGDVPTTLASQPGWLSGCSQVTSKCTPIPGLPALFMHGAGLVSKPTKKKVKSELIAL